LDLVYHDQAGQATERRHRLIQARQVDRVFQVKIVDRVGRYKAPGQGCLPALARADERDDAAVRQRLLNGMWSEVRSITI